MSPLDVILQHVGQCKLLVTDVALEWLQLEVNSTDVFLKRAICPEGLTAVLALKAFHISLEVMDPVKVGLHGSSRFELVIAQLAAYCCQPQVNLLHMCCELGFLIKLLGALFALVRPQSLVNHFHV